MPQFNLTSANYTNGNGTSPAEEQSNPVSWQSAFWPLVACTLALILQDTGRVCNAPYKDSYALRSSPLVCAIDTFIMIVKFVWMLCLGCSFTVAARHVWYDRFEIETFPRQTLVELFGRLLMESLFRILYLINNREVDGPTPMDTNLTSGVSNTEPGTLNNSISTGVPVTAIGDEQENALAELGETSGLPNGTEDVTDISLRSINDCLTGPGNSSSAQGDISLHGADNLEAGDTSFLTGANERSQVHPGSSIDRAWRLAMLGFLFGALPQAIKVFGMRGIPVTQALVGVQIVSFVVPEVLRALSGTAGVVNLHPMPSVVFAKKWISSSQSYCSFLAISFHAFGCMLNLNLAAMVAFAVMHTYGYRILTSLIVFAPFITLGLHTICWGLLRLSSTTSLLERITLPNKLCAVFKVAKEKLMAKLLGLFAVQTSFEDEIFTFSILYLFVVLITFTFVVFSNAWWKCSSILSCEIFIYVSTFYSSMFLLIPGMLLGLYIVFRILFMGLLSKYPRGFFGLEGTFREFFSGMFIGGSMLVALLGYAYTFYDPVDTFKPRWADMLG